MTSHRVCLWGLHKIMCLKYLAWNSEHALCVLGKWLLFLLLNEYIFPSLQDRRWHLSHLFWTWKRIYWFYCYTVFSKCFCWSNNVQKMYCIIKKSPFSSLWEVHPYPCLFEPSHFSYPRAVHFLGWSRRLLQPLDIVTSPEFSIPILLIEHLFWNWYGCEQKVSILSSCMPQRRSVLGDASKPSSFLSENSSHIKRNTGETENKSMSSADPDFSDYNLSPSDTEL